MTPRTIKAGLSTLPSTLERWLTTYAIAAPDDRFDPRVMAGEQMIFDPLAGAEVGQLAVVWYGDKPDPALRLLGIITADQPTRYLLNLSLDGSEKPLKVRKDGVRVHPCVGIMTPLDTPYGRAMAARRAAAQREARP